MEAGEREQVSRDSEEGGKGGAHLDEYSLGRWQDDDDHDGRAERRGPAGSQRQGVRSSLGRPTDLCQE